MIVLDTHVLVWWIGQPDKLSQHAQKIIEEAVNKNELLVSSISVWEIYLLVKRGRLKLMMEVDAWIKKIESLPFIEFIPIDNDVAGRSVNLPSPLHNDPADRMIIATAAREGATLLTSDKRILRYPHVKSVW